MMGVFAHYRHTRAGIRSLVGVGTVYVAQVRNRREVSFSAFQRSVIGRPPLPRPIGGSLGGHLGRLTGRI